MPIVSADVSSPILDLPSVSSSIIGRVLSGKTQKKKKGLAQAAGIWSPPLNGVRPRLRFFSLRIHAATTAMATRVHGYCVCEVWLFVQRTSRQSPVASRRSTVEEVVIKRFYSSFSHLPTWTSSDIVRRRFHWRFVYPIGPPGKGNGDPFRAVRIRWRGGLFNNLGG